MEQDPRSEPDWEAVGRDYQDGNGTRAEICERYGINAYGLQVRIQRHGWLMRQPRGPSARRQLITRLIIMFEEKVIKMEIAPSEAVQKEIELLGNMAKTLEKLCELERAGGGAGQAPRMKERDLAALRRRLAKRIDDLARP